MNAILYTSGDTTSQELTPEESKIFDEADKIIEQNSSDFSNKKSEHKSHIGLLIFSIIFFIVFLLASVFSTVFAFINVNNTTFVSGISILGIDVSGLSKDDAKQKVTDDVSNRLSTDVIFKHNDETYTLLPSSVGGSFDIDKVIDDAYSVGRNGNIFQNNFAILNAMINSKNFIPDFSFNSDSFDNSISQMNSNFADGIVEPSYDISGNNLIIKSGKNGNIVDSDKIKSLFVDKLIVVPYNTDSIEVPVFSKEANKIDIDAIHSEIYKEAQDASYTTNPYAVYPSSNGLDFNISIDEAKALITGDKDSYTIPLKTLYPNVKTSDIGIEAFPDLLSSYSTSFASSSSNRATNVSLATNKINGKVLMPGEVFSFNGTVGKRTPQAGFKVAGVYMNGQVATDYGGGICQVSSTLYNAVLRANLEIVDRSNHMFEVGYVPIGTDATVSWGAPDFKFKNSRSYPIKIVTSSSNRKCVVKFYGLKESEEYDIEIVSYRTGSVPYRTTYTTDSSLAAGQQKVIQRGSNGAKSVAYRIRKKNGQVISKELLSKDTYDPHNQIIAVGK
ncbi:putative vancomycin resistance protein [Clostridium sp. CAG:793]|nr:putative vancomycin resistance protein [Clostridium sp. CAG:793]